MRILMISDVYYPRVNGVSSSIETFCDLFRRYGHSVTLIAPHYGLDDRPETDVIRIPAKPVPFDPEDRLMSWRHINRRGDTLLRAGFDLIHIQTPFAAHYFGVRLAKKLSIPCIESVHTHFEEYFYHYIPLVPKRTLRMLARMVARRQCAAVDALVVPSRAMAKVLSGYDVKQVPRIIATGIHLADFRSGDGARFRKRHGIPVSRPTLIHVGRVALEKNIGFLIEVLAEAKKHLPEIQMIIAGEGPAKPTLEKLARRLGVREDLHFVGYQSRHGDLQDCYAAGDVFVFASNTETQGLVLLEAMALGVPVVSTAVLGTEDIVGPGRGALVAEENVLDFTEKVRQLLSDCELRTRLSQESREYTKEWGDDKLGAEMLSFYAQVTASRPFSAFADIDFRPADDT
ncbi:MAG: glycosyltransferase [Gammaproteobacteria bacterium]